MPLAVLPLLLAAAAAVDPTIGGLLPNFAKGAYWNGNPFFFGSFESHVPGGTRALATWIPKAETEHAMHGEWAWATHELPRGSYKALVALDEARERTFGAQGAMVWVKFHIPHPWSTVRLSFDPVTRHVDAMVTPMRAAFSCDGMRQNQAVTPYPPTKASKPPCWYDGDAKNDVRGEPQMMGGRLNITVLGANFLPNKDFFDSILGGGSDPYLSATVNGVVRNSTYVRNSQFPRWNGAFGNTVVFDRVVGGMPIDIKVFDKDAGLELFDDLLGAATIHVIKCSALYPPRDNLYWSTLKRRDFPGLSDHEQPPKKCREQTWVSLKPGYPCLGGNMSHNGANQFDPSQVWEETTDSVPCLLVRQEMIPFNVTVDAGHIFGENSMTPGNGRYPLQWIDDGEQSIQTQVSVAGNYPDGRPSCEMRDMIQSGPLYYKTGDPIKSQADLYTSPNTRVMIHKDEGQRSLDCIDGIGQSDDSLKTAMDRTLQYYADNNKAVPCAEVYVDPVPYTDVKSYLTFDGVPFMDRGEAIDGAYLPYRKAWGGMFIRTYDDDRNDRFDSYDNYTKARVKDYVTYHANMPYENFIFVEPIDFSTGKVPTWLSTKGSGDKITFPGDGGWVRREELRMMPDRGITYQGEGGGNDWKAFVQNFPENVEVTLGGNNFGIEDKKGVRRKNYIVTVRMVVPSFGEPEPLNSGFDAQSQRIFGILALVFGVPFFCFACCAWRFVAVVLGYKEEYVASYLAKQGPLRTEKERMAIGWLFVERTWGYGDFWVKHPPVEGFVPDPTSDEWRSNLYCATQMMWILLAFPIALFVTWCVVVIYLVTPALLGCAMLLVGGGFMFIAFAFLMWDRNAWRMDANTALLFAGAFACLIFFLLTTIVADAKAVTFFCVTCVSLTLNLMPMSVLAFIHNPELGQNLESLHPEGSKKSKDDADELMSLLMAVDEAEDHDEKKGAKQTAGQIAKLLSFAPSEGGVEALLRETLGDKVYSVDSAIPEFALADPLDWLAGALADQTQKLMLTIIIYIFAFLILFIYAIVHSLPADLVFVIVFAIFILGLGIPAAFFATSWNKSSVLPFFCAGIAETKCLGSLVATLMGIAMGLGVGALVGLVVAVFASSIAAIASTFGPNVGMWAWQNVCTLVILDTALMLLKRSEKCNWGPGPVTLYFALTRGCLAFWAGDWWLVGHASAFFVASIFCIHRLVNHHLPHLQGLAAGQIAFFGDEMDKAAERKRKEKKALAKQIDISDGNLEKRTCGRLQALCLGCCSGGGPADVSSRPEFVLLSLSFINAIFLVAAVQLLTNFPVVPVPMMRTPWPVWIFGILFWLLTLIFALVSLTARAFALEKHNLLEWATMFIWHPMLRLPVALACATEIMTITAGAVMYGATSSALILEISLFGPLIACTGAVVYSRWRANDFSFTEPAANRVKKKKKKKSGGMDDSDSDESSSDEYDESSSDDELGNALAKGKKHVAAMLGKRGLGKLGRKKVSGKGEDAASGNAFALPPLTSSPKGKGGKKGGGGGFFGGSGLLGGGGGGGISMPSLPLALPSLGGKKKKKKGGAAPLLGGGAGAIKFGGESLLGLDGLGEETAAAGAENPQAGGEFAGENPMLDAEGEPLTGMDLQIAEARKAAAEQVAMAAKLAAEEAEQDGEFTSTLPSLDGADGDAEGKKKKKKTCKCKCRSWSELAKDDPVTMPVTQAFFCGKLTSGDYLTLGMLAVFSIAVLALGVLMSQTEDPRWVGVVFWVAPLVLSTSLLPIIRYFNKYSFRRVDIFSIIFSFFIMTVALVCFLFFPLKCPNWAMTYWATSPGCLQTQTVGPMLKPGVGWWGAGGVALLSFGLNDVDTTPQALGLFAIFIWYPTTLLAGSAIYKFYDDGYRSSGFCIGALIYVTFHAVVWSWTGLVWWGIYEGVAIILGLLGSYFLGFNFVIWSRRGFDLPRWLRIADAVVVALVALIVLGLAVFNVMIVPELDIIKPFFAISVTFVVIIAWLLLTGAEAHAAYAADGDDTVYYSPYIFPVFYYDAGQQDIDEDNRAVASLFFALLLGWIWGVCACVFERPLGFGIAVCCVFLVIITLVIITLSSQSLAMLGTAAQCCDEHVVMQTAKQTRDYFLNRHKPFEVKFEEYARQDAAESKVNSLMDRYAIDDGEEKSSSESLSLMMSAGAAVRKINEIRWNLRNKGAPPPIGREELAADAKKKAHAAFEAAAKAEFMRDMGDDEQEDPDEMAGAGLVTEFSLKLDDVHAKELDLELMDDHSDDDEDVKAAKAAARTARLVTKAETARARKKKKRQERWVKIRALVLGEQGNRRLDGLFDTKSMLASLLLSDADGDGDVDMSDLEAKGPFGNGPGKFFGPIGLFTLPFHLTRIFIGWAHKESKDIIAANKKKAEEKAVKKAFADKEKNRLKAEKEKAKAVLGKGGKKGGKSNKVLDSTGIEMAGLEMPASEPVEEEQGGTGPLFSGPSSTGEGAAEASGDDGWGFGDEGDEQGAASPENENGEAGGDAEGEVKYDEYGREIQTGPKTEGGLGGHLSADETINAEQALVDLEEAVGLLDDAYEEEMRVSVLFRVSLMAAARARLKREVVLFKQFLRDNRFKLMANGISPPTSVFQTESYATVNIDLVASWMMRLTPEQKSRFRQLHSRFDEEIELTEYHRDQEDIANQHDAEALMHWNMHREYEMNVRRWQEFEERRGRRLADGRQVEAGPDGEGVVDPDEEPEWLINVREQIAEVEDGMDCRAGAHGRELQYHDSTFPHDWASIGEATAASSIVEWRVARAININADLFDAGTDPDDVYQGVLQDGWLLSAISILAASGGVDDDEVDPLVDRLFVNKKTEVGVYGVRLWQNAQWETVVLDDWFPTLDDEYKATTCGGAAFAYSEDFIELWVPVLEKAFAKYYGSYASLERGYVHHALQKLTGCHAEEIALGNASRGANKELLWGRLKRWKKNGFMMGAGTVTKGLADREVLDSGLVFGAVYVMYEVRQVDGNRLIKLRNPPDYGTGVQEWQGDWSDNSSMWTSRTRHKLDQRSSDEGDDGCFWMSFDDFCVAFRALYVCYYYDPKVWQLTKFQSKWSTENETASGLPHAHNMTTVALEDGATKRVHQPVEKNPQWGIVVDRLTDIELKISQTLNGQAVEHEPHPIGIYLLESTGDNPRVPIKATSLAQKDVVATSGDVARAFEVRLFTEVEPGAYVVICGAYQAEMEGDFELHVTASFPVTTTQLWPQPWGEGEAPLTFSQRVETGIASLGTKVKEKATALALKKLAEKGVGGEHITKLQEAISGETAAEKADLDVGATALAEAAKSNEPSEEDMAWIKMKQKDAEGNEVAYYFNKITNVSLWEVPEGYLRKKEAKKRKKRAKEQAEIDAMVAAQEGN